MNVLLSDLGLPCDDPSHQPWLILAVVGCPGPGELKPRKPFRAFSFGRIGSLWLGAAASTSFQTELQCRPRTLRIPWGLLLIVRAMSLFRTGSRGKVARHGLQSLLPAEKIRNELVLDEDREKSGASTLVKNGQKAAPKVKPLLAILVLT